MRVIVGRYVKHLRRERRSRKHIEQVCGCLRWMIDKGGINRVADFTTTSIDRALGVLANKGRAPRTINVYRRCAHSLAEWGVKRGMLTRNPAHVVDRRDESIDRRKVRRALTVDEAYRLLGVCEPRRLFYSVQLWAGLRVAETAALEWRDLDLGGDRPCVRLQPETTKARRADELPLHPSLAAALAEAKPAFATPTDRVFRTAARLRTFRGGWYTRNGKRRRYVGDLDRAGIALKDDQGRTVDRHALRNDVYLVAGPVRR